MRTHRVLPALQPWLWRREVLSELMTGANLVAARLEPVTRGREPTAFVDLHFSDGTRSIAVPLVYVDLAQLDVRELDPLVFPHGLLGVVTDAQTRDVVERIFPDLERRAMRGGFWSEEIIAYGEHRLDAARARGFFGAAPLAVSLPRIAPAVYAHRFAIGKRVIAYGPQAHEFAAFLGGVAGSCSVSRGDPEAAAWYGAFDEAAETTYDLAIGSGEPPASAMIVVRTDGGADGLRVPVVAPVPADIMLSFDEADGNAVAHFTVNASREPFTRTGPDIAEAMLAGGSAGRIAVVVRPGAGTAPDTDTDEARTLVAALGREGFTALLIDDVDGLDAFEPDLVHLFGVIPGAHARRVAEWASAHRRPLVVHALYETPAAGGYWGAMVAPYCFSYSADDRSVSLYLEMLARRGVEVDGIVAGTPFAPTLAGQADAERVLSLADVVLVHSERERTVVEAFRKRRPTFVVPPLPVVAGPAEPIASRSGTDPFVLVHAPIGPESNQLILARAALDVGAPMLIAGPIVDPAYAERLREFAPSAVVLLEEPSAALCASLYRTAGVVADAAWIARGHGRLATAAAMGAAIVTSHNRWLDQNGKDQWVVDPADVRSVSRGLGEAWDSALRGDHRIQATARFMRERLETAAANVVASYATIVQAV